MDLIDVAFNEDSHLARELFAVLGEQGNDWSHLLRVWQNAHAIAAHEPACDRAVLAAAVILHDCVAAEKNAPDRPLNDQAFALDQFGMKLFKIAENFQTKAGQALADQRTRTMRIFVTTLMNEITGGNQ